MYVQEEEGEEEEEKEEEEEEKEEEEEEVEEHLLSFFDRQNIGLQNRNMFWEEIFLSLVRISGCILQWVVKWTHI